MKTREEILSCFHRLFEGKIERTPSSTWGDLARFCAHLQLTELQPNIAAAYAEGLIPTDYVPEAEIRDLFELDPEASVVQALDQLEGSPLIDDPIHELLADDEYDDGGWGSEGDWDKPVTVSDPFLSSQPVLPKVISPEPIRRDQPKIGPNTPCPCGSGRKYKKCCARR